jgi:hypothetical protein
MKISLFSVLIVLGAIAADAPAAMAKSKLPTEFSYTIYVQGKPVGKSETKVTETAEGYLFESHTSISNETFQLDLTSQTEVDGNSMLPRKFTYSGNHTGQSRAGEAVFEETTVSGFIVENEEEYPYTQRSRIPNILLLEDYVMSHEVLIALAFTLQDEDPAEFGMLFPSAPRLTTVKITKGSDVAIESETEEAICLKFVIQIEGSNPFVSFFHSERNLPVYLAFPTSLTEVFLDDFFHDAPVSRYRDN